MGRGQETGGRGGGGEDKEESRSAPACDDGPHQLGVAPEHMKSLGPFTGDGPHQLGVAPEAGDPAQRERG